MGWYVYRLTNSVFLLGLISFLSMIPSVFISPFAGDLADRANRHRVILITQVSAMIQTTVLAVFVLSGFISKTVIWPLIVLSLMQGIIEAIDAPIRQSFVIDLIEKKSMLPNAIAMNSAAFNAARLIGPSIAGILIISFSEGMCFTFNAISYIPVIIMLLFINITYVKSPPSKHSTFHNVIEGWKYAYSYFPIRFLISNIIIFTLFGMSYATLLPVFARDVLHGDSRTLGLLMSTAGVGALTGALYLASRQNIKGLSYRMVIAGFVVSISLIVFSFSSYLYLSMFLLLIIGLGMMLQMASTNTMLQSMINDKMRGRVLSMYTMAYMSIAPFGSLMVGSLSSRFGVKNTLLFTAVICMLWAANGLRQHKNLTRGIQRMLIENKNQESYRPANSTITTGMIK